MCNNNTIFLHLLKTAFGYLAVIWRVLYIFVTIKYSIWKNRLIFIQLPTDFNVYFIFFSSVNRLKTINIKIHFSIFLITNKAIFYNTYIFIFTVFWMLINPNSSYHSSVTVFARNPLLTRFHTICVEFSKKL